jgi:hypothetical protein
LQQTGRFELFLDLLYVAILANFAETLAEDVTGAKLVKYIVCVCVSKKKRAMLTLPLAVDSDPIMARLERSPRTDEQLLQR